MKRWLRHPALRWLMALALLALIISWVDTVTLFRLLQRAEPTWIAIGLAVGALQIVLSSWRWWFTAHRLALPLGFHRAVGEYFLSTLLNQVLPGGITGDAGRAWRHHRVTQPAATSRILLAVMLERLSGQLVFLLWAALILVISPVLLPAMLGMALPLAALGVLLVLGILALLLLARRHGRVLREGLVLAFWPFRVLVRQFASSVLIVASYAVLFTVAGLALQVSIAPVWLFWHAPLILLAMLIPLSVSGWGFREGAAALVWSLAGMPPEEGVAVSVLYGLLVLISSLPGLLPLVRPEQVAEN